MRRIGLILGAGLFLIACSGGTPELPSVGKIDLRVIGKDSVVDIKSGVMTAKARESSDPAYSYARYGFALANFDLGDKEILDQTLNRQTSRIVYFELLGPSGSNKDTPLETGTYSTESAALPKVETLSFAVLTIVNDRLMWISSKASPVYETHGEVKITAIEGDIIRGELNITSGNIFTVRGNFTVRRTLVEPNLRSLNKP